MNVGHPFSRRSFNPRDENGNEGCSICGHPTGAHTLTTDRTDPRLGRGADIEPSGMNDAYLVLPDDERAKGFVRPVRRSYVHTTCGAVTTMGQALAETYARLPSFYGATYCAACRRHFPVGADGEFVWDGTTEKVGT